MGSRRSRERCREPRSRWQKPEGVNTSAGRSRLVSDLQRYIRERAARDPEFAEGLESGYADFRVGVLLRQAREDAGLTQEELAGRLNTKKSAISRIENHAGDIRLSTLERYAAALGRHLSLELRPNENSLTG
jgi:HTH-type transcriptional regulator/antitoxin HipB